MALDTFATGNATSVGGQGTAALLATALMANMDKDVQHFHGKTHAQLDQQLGVMATMEAAEHAAGGVQFSYSQVDSGPDGIPQGGVSQAMDELSRA